MANAVAAWWQRQSKASRDMYMGLGLLLVVGFVALWMAGELDASIPKAKVAEAAKEGVSFILGLVVLVAAAGLLYVAIVSANAPLAFLGVFVGAVGIALVGVLIGLPPLLEDMVELLNNLIKVLNSLIRFLGRIS